MNKKIELENCPVCGDYMIISSCPPPNGRENRHGKYFMYCRNCSLLFGWDVYWGCKFDTEEEAVNEWNKGQAFQYKKMWERLQKDISNYKKNIRICMSGLTKQGIADAISDHMEFIEEEAFREDDV